MKSVFSALTFILSYTTINTLNYHIQFINLALGLPRVQVYVKSISDKKAAESVGKVC